MKDISDRAFIIAISSTQFLAITFYALNRPAAYSIDRETPPGVKIPTHYHLSSTGPSPSDASCEKILSLQRELKEKRDRICKE